MISCASQYTWLRANVSPAEATNLCFVPDTAKADAVVRPAEGVGQLGYESRARKLSIRIYFSVRRGCD